MRSMAVKAVFLDVGETLINETRLWSLLAQWLNVPLGRFLQELETVIRQRRHHREVFERLQPGFDLHAAQTARSAAGWPADLAAAEDLYPDALACLARLRALGYRTGIAGNQPPGIEAALLAAGLDADVVASSSSWGVAKPSPAFFAKIVEVTSLRAAQIAYVGDRLDADVLPAIAAGMGGVFLKRGPWSRVHAQWPEVARSHLRIECLEELPSALEQFNRGVD